MLGFDVNLSAYSLAWSRWNRGNMPESVSHQCESGGLTTYRLLCPQGALALACQVWGCRRTTFMIPYLFTAAWDYMLPPWKTRPAPRMYEERIIGNFTTRAANVHTSRAGDVRAHCHSSCRQAATFAATPRRPCRAIDRVALNTATEWALATTLLAGSDWAAAMATHRHLISHHRCVLLAGRRQSTPEYHDLVLGYRAECSVCTVIPGPRLRESSCPEQVGWD